jgi:RND family efflux transporter MFP subunit
MKSIKNYFTWMLLLVMIFTACKNAGNNDSKLLVEKKAQLQKLTTEKNKLDDAIKKLQAEISLLDTNAANQSKFTLVAVTSVGVQKFDHYIDLRGRVDAENISYISPRGMGGQVKELYVKEGDNVKKGQLLLKLDDAIMKQSITAARQQLEGIKTQLNFAKDVYDRQNKLWQKGIGTEVQVIGAKTNVEALQNQLKSAEEQVKVGQEQLNTSAVYSDVDGVAETVMVKVGELFGGMGQIKIVNTSKLKVVANVPENYITQVKQGLPVLINVAEAGKTINSNISLIGQTIENSQRGFIAEAKIASESYLKPNQSVIMKILDYTSPNAVVIPINTLQSDENNKYVYVMEKLNNGKTVATRKVIVLGQVYGDLVEVKSGLTGGEQLITAGYQNLYEGQVVTTEMK